MSLVRIFENENWVVVDKPHGWLSVPSRFPSDDRPCVGLTLQQELKSQIYPVHRLDFEVSGLLIYAKNPLSHRNSQSWFEDSIVRKLYHAFSRPNATADDALEKNWTAKIVKGKRRAFEAAHGKLAHTKASLQRREMDLWFWHLEPITGRSHQLRFQMAQNGTPIIGDYLYGGEVWRPSHIALRAVSLDLSRVSERLGLPESLQVTDLMFV